MTDLGLAVMYHYVLPRDPAPPRGIRPLFVDEFEHQLDALGERYDIVHPVEFLRRIEEGAVSAKPACMLTFDDGTRDHLEVVAPILEKRGLRGLFFVLSWPIEERRMPLAHAVHWALSLDEHAVWDVFQRVASERAY